MAVAPFAFAASNLGTMPDVDQFRDALESFPERSESVRAFLQAHYNAKGRAATMTMLAASAGYPNYNSANLHYGKLAASIAQQLGQQGDISFVCHMLAPGSVTNSEWVLIMKSEFAQALLEAGWVERS